MATYVSLSGKRYVAGKVLGKGGEGQVFHVDGSPNLALKIYNPQKAVERKDKIHAMVAAGLAKTSDFVAYPIEVVNDQNGKFAGFTMKKVAGYKTVHDLYGPGSRKNEFPKADVKFLVRSALNLASAVASIHTTGCVIGDINHSGILVSPNALVTLIDADSFQFRYNNKTYRSLVGVPDYTPPELVGTSFEHTDRTSNHDAFGLAVMLFQLLFLGRHPYAGRFHGSGDMDISRAIKERRFAYSARRSETMMDPPPYVPSLEDFGDEVQRAFELAFSRQAETGLGRPSAAQWVSILRKLEANLVPCSVDRSHAIFRGKTSCVWCNLERQIGKPLFTAQVVSSGSTLNIGELIAKINAVQPPSSPPEPETIMPALPDLQPSEEAKSARRAMTVTSASGVVIGGIGAGLAFAGFGLGWFVMGIMAIIYFIVRGKRITPLHEAYEREQKSWEDIKVKWKEVAGPTRFHQKKDHYRNLAAEYSRLPQLEASKLAELERKKEQLQLKRFMENHLIDRAKIPNIGPSRKSLLASYGVETAWDALHTPITGISGFGPVLQETLLDWAYDVQRKFRFNPNAPTDPQAIKQVKDEIAKRRAEIERELMHAIPELNRLRDEAVSLIKNPPSALVQAYRKLLQAKADLDYL